MYNSYTNADGSKSTNTNTDSKNNAASSNGYQQGQWNSTTNTYNNVYNSYINADGTKSSTSNTNQQNTNGASNNNGGAQQGSWDSKTNTYNNVYNSYTNADGTKSTNQDSNSNTVVSGSATGGNNAAQSGSSATGSDKSGTDAGSVKNGNTGASGNSTPGNDKSSTGNSNAGTPATGPTNQGGSSKDGNSKADGNLGTGAGALGIPGLPNASGPSGPMVTQYDAGADGRQTVRACPTGAKNYECIEAIYDKSGVIVTVHVISITITTNEKGESSTKTETRGDKAQITPEAKLSVDSNGDDKNRAGVDAGTPDITLTTEIFVTETKTIAGKQVVQTIVHTSVRRVQGTAATGTAANAKPTHKVKVGRDDKFEPATLDAKPGDIVRFTFLPRNHSVTTCDAERPCVPNNQFDSGFKYTFIQNSTTFIDYPVGNDTKPLYFFS